MWQELPQLIGAERQPFMSNSWRKCAWGDCWNKVPVVMQGRQTDKIHKMTCSLYGEIWKNKHRSYTDTTVDSLSWRWLSLWVLIFNFQHAKICYDHKKLIQTTKLQHFKSSDSTKNCAELCKTLGHRRFYIKDGRSQRTWIFLCKCHHFWLQNDEVNDAVPFIGDRKLVIVQAECAWTKLIQN